MKWRVSAVLSLGTALWGGSFGCSSATDSAGGAAGASNGNVAGAADVAGAPSGNAAGASPSGGDTVGSGGSTADSACVEHPTPQRTQGTLLSLSLAPVLSGKPFVFGQPNALVDGSSVVPLNFRFYVSQVQLLRSSGDPVAVDVVSAAGDPEPYGLHLFNAEDDASSTLRVLAPAGQYSGLSFSLGIKLACNQQLPANLDDPLTDASQMTWPHTGGFLFLRYEGRDNPTEASTGESPEVPTAVHMGGSIQKELAPSVTVSGALSIPESGTLEKSLSVSMDEIFSGASADIDVSDFAVGIFSTPEAIAGERLRRDLPERHVFSLEP
jgi:hypothetical protein